MQKMLESGKVKNIGVSNFQIKHLEKLLNDPACKVVPAINQLEVRQYYSRDPPYHLNVRCLTLFFSCTHTTHREDLLARFPPSFNLLNQNTLLDQSCWTIASPKVFTVRHTHASVEIQAHLSTNIPTCLIIWWSRRLPKQRANRRLRFCK